MTGASEKTDGQPSGAGPSRRSVLKAGAAAGGAATVIGMHEIITADGEVLAQQDQQQSVNGLVFVQQFFPSVDFELVSEIDNPEEILQGGRDGVEPVANPDEWDGFIVRYDISEVPLWAIAFITEDVGANEGQRFQFDPQASIISQELNVMNVDALPPGAAGEETPTEGTPGEETPTEETPGEETPTEGTPGEETPTEGTPGEETPTETPTGNQTVGGG